MSIYLGIDTSNYTTSAALYFSDTNQIIQQKILLPVKKGELGLRQSDAVFHHTKQLPIIMDKLIEEKYNLSSISVSVRPRNVEGSYMPCFLTGECVAESIGKVLDIPVVKTSHQVGHILAALYSCNKLNLVKEKFIAFHVSGGTTDCLLVSPDEDEVIKIEEIGTSLDLKAGQAVDRIGLMLGLDFPCGKWLDELSLKSSAEFKIKPTLKDNNCCLSGLENKCKSMFDDNIAKEDIAKYCIDFICETLSCMTIKAKQKYGNLPLVFAGGVMSNTIIRKTLTDRFGAYFAKPEFSCDNAAGIAVFSSFKEKK